MTTSTWYASWFNIFDDSLAEIVDLITETGLKNYHLLNLLEQEDLAEVMNKTDIGIFPNRVEGGTNLVLMEYLACGKPVIASYGTGQRGCIEWIYPTLCWLDWVCRGSKGNSHAMAEFPIITIEPLSMEGDMS